MAATLPGDATHHPQHIFKEGLPSAEQVREHADRPRLFVLDDLMSTATDSAEVCSMFTEGSHHYNYSVVCVTQNLFYKGKNCRTMSLNSSYLLLLRNPRDSLQVSALARQIFPSAPNKLLKPYMEATSKPHGYLFIDFKQETPEKYRIVKNIFHSESYDQQQNYPPRYSISEDTVRTKQQENMANWQMANPPQPTYPVYPPNLYNAAPQQPNAIDYPQPKRVKLDESIYDNGIKDTACLHCGIIFDTVTHRDEHQDKCRKAQVDDDSIFDEIYREVGNAVDKVYRNTLIRIHELNRSGKHREMYQFFENLVKTSSPEIAAKKTVKQYRDFFESLEYDDESYESS